MFNKMEIYVGNLPWSAEDQDLNDAFGQYGEVTSAKIINDRETGRSRGFAFVTMTNDDEARQAIEALNDTDFMGRSMNCREATPRQEKPRHGGGGGDRGGRGGFNRGGDRGGDRGRDRRY
jgi:cold-inducible RNA-binding protein